MSNIVKIIPVNIEFQSSHEEFILDAALKSNILLSHSCRNGDCGVCEATLHEGMVVDNDGNVFVEGQKILTCCTKAKTDVTLAASYYPELASQVKKIIPCKVDDIIAATDSVLILKLKCPPTSGFSWLPGQYINLIYKGVTRSYSVANINKESHQVELHIRRVSAGVMSELLFALPEKNTLMRMEGPCGTFFIRENDRPVIFVAGGTGFAPVKSMVEWLIENNINRDISIYWGAVKAADFYSSLPDQWSDKYENIHFIPVVSGVDDNWAGRRGYVHQAVMNDFTTLADFDVYVCGSPQMIECARDDFIQHGLSVENFYSDAFTAAK